MPFARAEERSAMPVATRAALLRAFNTPLTIEEIILDDPGPGEVVVRLAATGVCHSDYHMLGGAFKSQLPIVLGHAGAGVLAHVTPDARGVGVGEQLGPARRASSWWTCGQRRWRSRVASAPRTRWTPATRRRLIRLARCASSPAVGWTTPSK